MPDFDLSSFDTADTTFMQLKDPIHEEPIFVTVDGEKVAVGITFDTPGSEAYEAAVSKRTNRSLARSKRKIDLTADLLRSDSIGFLADITRSFDHLAYPAAGDAQGADLFKALYGDRKKGWIVEQANAHLGDRARFTPASQTS